MSPAERVERAEVAGMTSRGSAAPVHAHRKESRGERAGSVDPAWLTGGLVAGIIVSLVAQVWLIFTLQFNGDELHFVARVHDHLQGSLDLPMKTLHVHLFAPLAALPGNEVEQLTAGRLASLWSKVEQPAAFHIRATCRGSVAVNAPGER